MALPNPTPFYRTPTTAVNDGSITGGQIPTRGSTTVQSPSTSSDYLDIPTRNSNAGITVPSRTSTLPTTQENILGVPGRPSVNRPTNFPTRSSQTLSASMGSGGSTPTAGETAMSNPSALQTLGDIFKSMFGQSQGIQPTNQQPPSVVPVGESGGGSNTFLILGALIVGGVAIWYFYFR